MNILIGEFAKAAHQLSRNPLGIIALFIVLVYGIAGLVLGFSSEHLQANERMPLIWFMVIFPVFVLLAFYRLVVNHHTKLYAPHDFPDKEGFFRALSPGEQKIRLDEEIQMIESENPPVENGKVIAVEMEGSGILRSISARHTYVLVEELALREIESDFGVTVQRQVAVQDHGVDGLFFRQGKPVVIEIKFVRSSQSHSRGILRRQIERFAAMFRSTKPGLCFLLVLVTEGMDEAQKKVEVENINEWAKDLSFPLELRVYDFASLKRKYGILDDVAE